LVSESESPTEAGGSLAYKAGDADVVSVYPMALTVVAFLLVFI
jgi:hypothetical protein